MLTRNDLIIDRRPSSIRVQKLRMVQPLESPQSAWAPCDGHELLMFLKGKGTPSSIETWISAAVDLFIYVLQ